EEREEMARRLPAHRRGDARELQDRFELGGEQQFTVPLGEIERLDSEPVASEQQLAPRYIPDRKRKHAAEAIHAARPELLVQVHDRFRVACRPERVAGALEVAPQLLI